MGISIKRKRDLNNGSYDYLNSTVPVSYPSLTLILVDVWKEETLALAPTQENKRDCKAGVQCCVLVCAVATIDTNTLTDIVSDTFEAQAGMDIAITDQATESLYLFSADDMEVPQLLKAGYKAQIVQTNNIVTSRKIVFVKDDDIRDVGLRIRLVTNNGVGALMGMSKANKTSSVVVKIQQDKVGRMVHNTPHKVIAM